MDRLDKGNGRRSPVVVTLSDVGVQNTVQPLDRAATYFNSLGAFHSLA